MLNGACGPFAPFLRMNLPTKLANSLQGDFLRVVAGDRPAKSRKWLCRAPNRCGVLCGQMAKVELRRSSQNSPSTHSGEYGTVASPAGKNSWPLHLCLPVCEYGTSRRARKATATERRWRERTMPEVTKDRALLGALAVL